MIEIFGLQINVYAQIFGLIGLIFVVIAYQANEKLKYLRFTNISFLFTICEAFILGAITSAIKITTGIIRNIVVAIYIKKNKKMPMWFNIIFIAMAILPSLFFIYSFIDWFPIMSSIASTIATCQNNYKLLKAGGILVEIFAMVHSIYIGAYIGFIRQFIILISIIIGLIKYINYENKYKPIIY